MSAPITYAFGNIGRGSDDDDRDALEALFAAMPDERWVISLCEINEGDRNDELALAKRLAPKGSRFYCQRTREPIVLSPDFTRARSRVIWIENSSVQHWSPRRSVNVVHLPGETISVIGAHPAAGAYHGDRPAAARTQLRTSWGNTHAQHRKLEAGLQKRGRDVVWTIDYNRTDLPPVVTGEQTVFHDVTDWGRVLPAKGHAAEFHYVRSVPFHVDSHDGHVMRGRFTEESK